MMIGLLTTREFAIILWAGGFLVFVAIARQEVRESLLRLAAAALHLNLVMPAVLLAAYTALAVRALEAVGVWTQELLKDTILWFLFSGLALAFSGVQSAPEDGLWRRVVVAQLKIIVVLEYVVDTYTFALWVELLLVPLLAFIAMLDVVARSESTHAAVAKLTAGLQAIAGLTVMGLSTYQAVSRFGDAPIVDALRTVILAPALSISLVPFVFVFSILSSYEQLFLRLSLGPPKAPAVVRYTKLRLLRHLGPRPHKVWAFVRAHAWDLMRIATKEDVDKMMAEVGCGGPDAGSAT